jgi:hypothetical protein
VAEPAEFISLEETRRLAVLAAHATIARLTLEPTMTLSQAQLLRGLVGIINDAEELEIKKFMITRRPPGGADRAPDPAGAEAIAAGEQPR